MRIVNIDFTQRKYIQTRVSKIGSSVKYVLPQHPLKGGLVMLNGELHRREIQTKRESSKKNGREIIL